MSKQIPHNLPPLTCEEVDRLLGEYIADPSDMAPDQKEALEAHLKTCAVCKYAYEHDVLLFQYIGENWGEISNGTTTYPTAYDLAVDDQNAASELEPFDAEKGLQDLFRRCPDLANAYHTQVRRKRFYKLLRYTGIPLAAAACVVIAALVGWHLSSKPAVSNESITAVQQPSKPVAPAQTPIDDTAVGGLTWLDKSPAPLSMATLDYKSWRDENREWFSRQYPQMFKVQEILAAKYNIQADYIELLMVSGDLWQFHYDPKGRIGQPLTVYTPSSLERLATHYELPFKEITAAAKVQSTPVGSTTPATSTSSESAIADLQTWGRTVKARLNDPKGIPIELQLSLLQAGTYLGKTRTAAYLWLRENRDTAKQVIVNQPDAVSLIGANLNASADIWLARLDAQGQAASRVAWSGQHLITAPVTDSCTVLPVEFRAPLFQALDGLMPNILITSLIQQRTIGTTKF